MKVPREEAAISDVSDLSQPALKQSANHVDTRPNQVSFGKLWSVVTYGPRDVGQVEPVIETCDQEPVHQFTGGHGSTWTLIGC